MFLLLHLLLSRFSFLPISFRFPPGYSPVSLVLLRVFNRKIWSPTCSFSRFPGRPLEFPGTIGGRVKRCPPGDYVGGDRSVRHVSLGQVAPVQGHSL